MKSVSVWKEVNSRLPTIPGAIHEFFKSDDGEKSFFPKPKDEGKAISLFMKKMNSKGKGKTEYIDPKTRSITFTNDNDTLDVKIDKKRMVFSWNGDVACNEGRHDVTCSVFGSPAIEPKFSDAGEKKTPFRFKPKVKETLQRKQQTRESREFTVIDLWTEAKTNVRDINQLALLGVGAGLAGGVALGFALPAVGLLAISSPMVIGAPVLANGEAFMRNNKAEWYIDGDMRDYKWINKINVNPGDVEKVTVFQDDEFFFHAKIFLKEPRECTVIEESDMLTVYPQRRLECNG